MTFIFTDSLKLGTMASGNLFLNLSEKVNWQDFSAYAEKFAKKVGGKIIEEIDSVDVRIFKIKINFSTLRLVYEDYPQMVSLESTDSPGDDVIRKIYDDFTS